MSRVSREPGRSVSVDADRFSWLALDVDRRFHIGPDVLRRMEMENLSPFSADPSPRGRRGRE
jgi:hypothetical protein